MLTSTPVKAGQVIARKRLSNRVRKSGNRLPGPMSLRDLEEELKRLELQNPALYKSYSRSTQARIENEGAEYILEKLTDPQNA